MYILVQLKYHTHIGYFYIYYIHIVSFVNIKRTKTSNVLTKLTRV
jgi:hypothetical protein